MPLHELEVRIEGDSSGLERALENAEESIEQLENAADSSEIALSRSGESAASAFTEARNAAASLAGTVAGLAVIQKSAEGVLTAFSEYASYESSVMRVSDIFRENGDAVTEFAQKHASALNISEGSVYEYAAVYGNLFRNITADTEENAKVTIAMLRSSGIIAQKTGRTMSDVMERIRSGLLGNTEAIEDLGIYVNVAMLETTEAFKKIADGRSWEQLDFYEQQQIRTLAILEQASSQFGSGTVQNTASSVAALSAAFSDLKVTAGGLAAEILVPLIQVLTSVARGVRGAVEWVRSLNGTSKTYLVIAGALALGIPAVTLATKGLALAQAGLHAVQAILIPQTLTFGAVLKSALGWISLLALAIGVLYAIFGGKDTDAQSESMESYNDALKNTELNALKTADSIDSVKDSTQALSNELRRSLAGFDELNILNDDGSTGNQSLLGFDASGIEETAEALGVFDDLDYDLEFDSNAAGFTDTVSGFFGKMWVNIKKGFKDWTSWWGGLGSDMYDGIHDGNWEPLLTRLDGVVEKLFGDEWSAFWEKAGENMYTGIKEGDWEPILTQFDDWMRDKFGDGWSDFWQERGAKMYDSFVEAKEEIGPVLGAIFAGAEFIFGEDWTTFWEEVGADIFDMLFGNSEASYNALSDLNDKIRSLFGSDWTDFWEGVGEAIYDAFHGYTMAELEVQTYTKGYELLSDTVLTEENKKKIAFSSIKKGYESTNSGAYPQQYSVPEYSYPRQLPGYATGGIVTRPTVAQFGENGAEAVIPLERNTEWIDRVAERIRGSASQSEGVFHVHVDLDGREIGKASFRYAELEKSKRGG